MALHQGVVALVHRALAERPLQRGVSTLALGQHHQPGRVRVQPVDDALPLGGTAGRDGVPGGEQAFQHGRPAPARRRVGRDTGRLVHHHDVGVLIDDGQPRHRLRCRRGCGRRGRVTSSHSPAGTRSDLAAGCPATSTCPPEIRSAATERESPNMRASAASRRSPSSPSGTATRRWSLAVTPRCPRPRSRAPGPAPGAAPPLGGPALGHLPGRGPAAHAVPFPGPVEPDAPCREEHGEGPAADDRRVGQVEDRPVRQLDPVHDIAAEQAR